MIRSGRCLDLVKLQVMGTRPLCSEEFLYLTASRTWDYHRSGVRQTGAEHRALTLSEWLQTIGEDP